MKPGILNYIVNYYLEQEMTSGKKYVQWKNKALYIKLYF